MSYIDVQINTESLDTEDLIEIVESRGYDVLMSGQTHEDTEALNRTVDEIHNLYHAFIHWKDFALKDSTFESDLKKFFETTVDLKVI